MSFMAKFLVQGPQAGELLEWLSANHVDGPEGRVTYTPWLNEAGTVEADLTVTKLDAERYLVVASDTVHRHVETWLRRQLPGRAAAVTDMTSAYTLLSLQGPRSRDVLQRLTTADLSTAAFPFRTAREIDVALARVLCLRITYVGELGYELYVPTEHAPDVHDRLKAAGTDLGLRHVGLKALGSLRLEKGYRANGSSRCCSSVPSRCCTTRRASTVPGVPWATSAQARTATHWGRRWAWPWSRSVPASRARWTRRGWTPAAGRSTSPGSCSRRRSRCVRCTTRVPSACRPEAFPRGILLRELSHLFPFSTCHGRPWSTGVDSRAGE